MNYSYCEDSFSDLYKDVNGFRPRYHEFWGASPDRKQEIWDALMKESEEKFIEDERREAQAIIDFNEKVEKIMNEYGAKDRKTAIRWLIVDEDDDCQDVGYILYQFGLPYSMKAELESAMEM